MWTSIDAPDWNIYSLISSPHFILEVLVSFGLFKNTVITSLGKGFKKVSYSILEGGEHRRMVETVFSWKWDSIPKKSQNFVKAAVAFLCTTCKRQLLFALLQLITFVCTTAIENISTTTPMVNFLCNIAIGKVFMEQQLLYELLHPLQLKSHYYSYWLSTAQWQLTTFYALLQLTTFLCTIAIDNFCLEYCNWGLLHAAHQH